MTGLLDWIKTPEGQGLLSAAFGGLANARRGAPLNSIGGAGMAGLMGYSGALDRQDQQAQQAKRNELYDMQLQTARLGMDATRQQMADKTAQRDYIQGMSPSFLAGQTALAGGGGPTVANAARIPSVTPMQQALHGAAVTGAVPISDYLNTFKPKEPKYTVVDGNLVRTDTETPTVAFTAPQKPEATPSAIREYQFAQGQGYKGNFQQWVIDQKKAGASQVNVNNDNLGLKPKDRFEMEGKLSDDFMKATQLDRGVLNATSKISAAFTETGAMKDQAAIYSFAKMLDPEGAVREADYAAIANTSGLVDRVRNYANKLLTGEQLSPTQRAEMMSLAKSFEKVANSRIGPQRSRFGNQAQRYNLSPDAVLSPDNAATGWSITPVR